MDQINYFEIHNLHGSRSYKVHFIENKLILVGENGSGKTTVLRILYHFLSGEWEKLRKFKFDYVSMSIGDTCFSVTSDSLNKAYLEIKQDDFREYPLQIRQLIRESLLRSGGIDYNKLMTVCDHYGIDHGKLTKSIDHSRKLSIDNKIKFYRLSSEIKSKFPYEVLYFPTYRRIEKDLDSILEGRVRSTYDTSSRRVFSRANPKEQVEFGMSDITLKMNEIKNDLREYSETGLRDLTFKYLGELVDEEYHNFDFEEITKTDKDTIQNALDRTSDAILTPAHKTRIKELIVNVRKNRKYSAHDQVICHYLKKLLNFYKSMSEQESNLVKFKDVCNEYLVGKQIIYDPKEFSIAIYGDDAQILADKLDLECLSSGEKQVISLMFRLYLSEKEAKYFIIIDEPELSLSVPWQRRFLVDIANGGHCAGLLVATHSPFIFDNELQKFVRGLGESQIPRGSLWT